MTGSSEVSTQTLAYAINREAPPCPTRYPWPDVREGRPKAAGRQYRARRAGSRIQLLRRRRESPRGCDLLRPVPGRSVPLTGDDLVTFALPRSYRRAGQAWRASDPSVASAR